MYRNICLLYLYSICWINEAVCVCRLRTLVKTAKKKLREQNGGELGSPMGSLRGELSYRQNETEGAVSRMKIKVCLHVQNCLCWKMANLLEVMCILHLKDIVQGWPTTHRFSPFIILNSTIFLFFLLIYWSSSFPTHTSYLNPSILPPTVSLQVDELQVQLEREALRCSKLEDMNRELKEQLSSLKSLGRSHERLERSKQQLEEEVTGLRRRMEAGVMDQSQAEQFRRETEERARQEIRHKLDEINLFLQVNGIWQSLERFFKKVFIEMYLSIHSSSCMTIVLIIAVATHF